MSQVRILLIEDDVVDGMFFQRTLKATGIEANLTIAENADSGIKIFIENQFDCVFLDYMLPGTDGIEVLTKLRENRDSSIVLITSHGDEKIAVEAMKAGALDYISKGLITSESIAQIIRNVKRLQEAEQGRRSLEAAFKQSEKRHRIFFEKSQGFLCTHDLDGNFITVNTAGATSINYTPEQLIGTNLKKIISPATQYLFDDYLKKISTEKSITGIMKVISKNGEERTWMYSNYLHEESNETYVIGSVQDITDRVKMEEEKLYSQRLAQESAEIQKLANELSISSNKITDSINYAKRLQNGIYICEERFKKTFPNSFIIDYPKEIIGGDFYWLHEKNNKIFLALGDCTGHGVPGALLSTLGYSMLNNLVLNNNFTSPDQTLKKLCIDWRQMFGRNNQNNIYDGMEISLCYIDQENHTIEFAGMAGTIFLATNGLIQEYQGENVGTSSSYLQKNNTNDDLEKITCHKIPFQKNDRLYLFSDGYRDQFGGPNKNSKFTKKRFKNLILTIQAYPFEKQKQLIDDTFLNWKGTNGQMDDVLVIGVQL